MARQAADDAAFLRRAKALVRLLRNQAGIPVRQPAHAVAPFRAEPINFACTAQLTKALNTDLAYDLPVLFAPAVVFRNVEGPPGTFTATATSTEDTARGPSDGYFVIDSSGTPTPISVTPFTDSGGFQAPGIDPFPDGYLGFITGVEVSAFRGDNVIDHIVERDLRFTLLVDGQSVSGFTNAYPRTDLGVDNAAGVGTLNIFYPRVTASPAVLGCPIQVRPGQRVTIRLRAPALTAASIVHCRATITGYKIPTKTGGDRTIYDTLTD